MPLASNPVSHSLSRRSQPLGNLTPRDIVEINGLNHSTEMTNLVNNPMGGLRAAFGILQDSHIGHSSEARHDRIKLFRE